MAHPRRSATPLARLARAAMALAPPLLIAATIAACTAPEPPRVVVPMQPRADALPLGDGGLVVAQLSSVAQPERTRTVLGKWEGTGVQDDGTTWLMVVEISSLRPGPCGTALYPTVPCAGTWTCVTESDGRSLNAIERITEGRRECVDGGTMRMFVTSDGSLEWAWSGAGENAHARLRRTGGPE